MQIILNKFPTASTTFIFVTIYVNSYCCSPGYVQQMVHGAQTFLLFVIRLEVCFFYAITSTYNSIYLFILIYITLMMLVFTVLGILFTSIYVPQYTYYSLQNNFNNNRIYIFFIHAYLAFNKKIQKHFNYYYLLGEKLDIKTTNCPICVGK